jgi:hypothetical protein
MFFIKLKIRPVWIFSYATRHWVAFVQRLARSRVCTLRSRRRCLSISGISGYVAGRASAASLSSGSSAMTAARSCLSLTAGCPSSSFCGGLGTHGGKGKETGKGFFLDYYLAKISRLLVTPNPKCLFTSLILIDCSSVFYNHPLYNI